MNTELEIVKSEAAPSVAHMLQSVITAGVTEQNVAALERLCTLYEKMQTIEAAKQFAQAFAALQNELPAVQATKSVPNNDGTVRYKFAPYQEIMRQIQPMLTKHGFSVRFSSTHDDQRLTMVCTLMHVGGHSLTNEFSVRVGKGPPGASEAQSDGSAASYAQRGALCDSLNIVVRHDDDARALGASVTAEQATSLRERVMATASDEAAFLKYAGAASFETITATKYAMLDQSLKKKERVS